jgi:hypothetical protein
MDWRMRTGGHVSPMRRSGGLVVRLALALVIALSLAGSISTGAAGAAPFGGPFVSIGTSPPGNPISSGALVTVHVPPNHVLQHGAPLAIEECSAPNWNRTFFFNNCDPTTKQGGRVNAGRNGSVTYTGYAIVTLPTGPGGPGGHQSFRNRITCDSTHPCVLVVGSAFGNWGHQVWSRPFFVGPASVDPGTGTPEVPYVLVLPVLAIAVIGGYVLIRRRRATPHPAH